MRCHSNGVAKPFDADFYIVCATIIPVLFLAVAVQGRAYESVLRAALAMAEASRGECWKRQLWPIVLSRFLKFAAYAIWVAGGLGELLALLVLYQGHEQGGDRAAVFALTAVLVVATVIGPLNAYMNTRQQLDELGLTPGKPAEGEEVPGAGQPLEPSPVARPIDHPA